MTVAHHIRVTGIVQGVGYRPFVRRLACELSLSGWVRNDAAGVEITAEGCVRDLEALLSRLRDDAPPTARVDGVAAQAIAPTGIGGFSIAQSVPGTCATAIGPDTAVCADCLAELFAPDGRRWRHPFITCTHCGPRYTITRALPYDRSRTSMAAFALCSACDLEYRDPADRRFHAEPIACPQCGPRLALVDASGNPLAGDPIAQTLARLLAGSLVAIKGLGGYHLACDARNGRAVAALRERKHRDAKPFAIMVANPGSLAGLAAIDATASGALRSPARPVVLVPKHAAADREFAGIAEGMGRLGVMLPSTPIHWLLFHEAAGRPEGTAWTELHQSLALVMTSANPGGEPLIIDEGEGLRNLAGIADAHLQHDRAIVVRCDDSVVAATEPVRFLRRARGFAPMGLRLHATGPPVLATGAHFKNTICVARGDQAYVSQHIGDLDDAATIRFLEESVDHLVGILGVEPAAIGHDLHPDFASTRLAAELAARWQVPLVGVQHHHAHIAAVLAEHRFEGPVLGLVLDGVGYGTDGGAWGGELLRVHGASMRREGHLAPLPLAGGDRAAVEPWRMAAGALHALGRNHDIERRFGRRPAARSLAKMLDRGVHCPLTSSMGRVFDAAAALLGVAELSRFEAEAAMRLEALAGRAAVLPIDDLAGLAAETEGVLDLRPLLGRLADWTGEAADGAAFFHAVAASAVSRWLQRAAGRTGIGTVVLAGGCFMNLLFRSQVESRLSSTQLRVLQPVQLPPNDGAISAGQAWVARHPQEN